mmetsp:Transcript_30644/g.75180  ORF Transcript_30644/g.75180 Transcript_30644/m.75180 type:complete len:435 (-) Transcript_30644:92-1396(-)
MSKCELPLELPPRAVAFNKRGDVLTVACDGQNGQTSLITYDYLYVEGMLEALCMALHPRLGAHSPLAVLDGAADVLEKSFSMSQKTRLVERARTEGSSGRTLSIAFSPDDRHLVSGGEDGDVIIWDAAGQLTEASRLQGHTERVTCVDYNPAGTFVASSSWDCSIRLWDPRTGLCSGVLSGHDEIVSSISFSPDGLVLASAGMDEKSVRLWSVNTGYQKDIALRGLPKSTARAVEFSPDGQVLAVACRDWTVRLYDAHTGLPVGVGAMSSHWGLVSCVKFSPDGTLLASGSDDGTVRIWRTATGQQVGQALQHMACVNGMTFCKGCSDLATASGDLWTLDRAVHIWNGKDANIIHAKRADFAVAEPTHQQMKETKRKVKALRRKQQALGINPNFGASLGSDGDEQEDEAEKEKQRMIADVFAYRQWLANTGRLG